MIDSAPGRDGSGPWPWWARVGFRFAFLFWGDYCLQGSGVLAQVLWMVPWLTRTWVVRWPMEAIDWPTTALGRWLTERVFRLTGDAATWHPTGSGDTAQAWIGFLALLIFAAAGTLVWTAISEVRRRRREYHTLYAWLRLAVRFSLAAILLSYGLIKVFPLQFMPPDARRLGETFGQSSPMGLLWTFMGFSVPYTIFAGIAETVPGILLCFRRTSTMGALGAAIVLSNVVLLNFCYDVPVKLNSSEYLAMALFLLLPDVAPLWRFLVLRRPAVLTGVWLPRWERRPLRVASYVLQVLVIGHLLWMYTSSSYGMWKQDRQGGAKPLPAVAPTGIDGRWIVVESSGWLPWQAWKTVAIGSLRYQSVDYFEVVQENGEQWNYSETMDMEQGIHFLKANDSEMHWRREANGDVTLEGTWRGTPAKMRLRPAPFEFPLMTRGFHWVQEMPFNR